MIAKNKDFLITKTNPLKSIYHSGVKEMFRRELLEPTPWAEELYELLEEVEIHAEDDWDDDEEDDD